MKNTSNVQKWKNEQQQDISVMVSADGRGFIGNEERDLRLNPKNFKTKGV